MDGPAVGAHPVSYLEALEALELGIAVSAVGAHLHRGVVPVYLDRQYPLPLALVPRIWIVGSTPKCKTARSE